MNVNHINCHPRDAALSFDPESHTYHYDGRELRSVTTLVEDLFPKFDKEYFAARVAAREGCDPAVILSRWEAEAQRARDLGTALHDKIERHYLGLDPGDTAEDAFPLFLRFAEQEQLRPYRTEWRIYHEGLGIAGTLDFLERTADGVYNLYDWKRSHKLVDHETHRIIIDNRYHQTALPPLDYISDTSYWHYALQLSIYRYILAEKYGIKVSGMYLGVFHPSYETGWKIQLPYLSDALARIFGSK